jgi:YHS domain-containing protein
MAFIFADLIILPILNVYRKYYGRRFTVRITALMFVTMVTAALVISGLFHVLGLVPSGARPTRADIFSSIAFNYKLVLNVLGVAIFAGLVWLTARRGVTDPVCGMKVDRDKAVTLTVDGQTHFFCSEHCLLAFQNDPDRRPDAG